MFRGGLGCFNVPRLRFTVTGPDQRLYMHMIQMHLDILEIISRMSFSAVNVIAFKYLQKIFYFSKFKFYFSNLVKNTYFIKFYVYISPFHIYSLNQTSMFFHIYIF